MRWVEGQARTLLNAVNKEARHHKGRTELPQQYRGRVRCAGATGSVLDVMSPQLGSCKAGHLSLPHIPFPCNPSRGPHMTASPTLHPPLSSRLDPPRPA